MAETLGVQVQGYMTHDELEQLRIAADRKSRLLERRNHR